MWSVFDSVTKQLKGSLGKFNLLVKNEVWYKAMHFTYAFPTALYY